MADWKGVSYSNGDMLHMQQEAIRRVRQMQQRTARTVGGADPAEGGAPQEGRFMPQSSPAPQRPPAQEPQGTAGGAPPRPPPRQQRAAPPPASLLGQIGNSLGLGGLGGKLGDLREKLGMGGDGDAPGGSFIKSLVGEESPIAKVLDALGMDNERILIIILLLVLLNEKSDKTLIIALVYLLL